MKLVTKTITAGKDWRGKKTSDKVASICGVNI
jgi:hypothetical protein